MSTDLIPVQDWAASGDGLWRRRGQVAYNPVPAPRTLLDVTFDDWADGSPNSTYWNARMGGGGVNAELARHTVVAHPTDTGSKCMRLRLLANTKGSEGSTAMFVPLSEATDDVRFMVKFMFEGAYDVGKGQKFPGPSGVRAGIDPGFPSGCKTVVDEGYSARCMQATHAGHPDGNGLTYIYGWDVDRAKWACGEDNWWPTVMTAGVWHTLETRVRLNTVTAGTPDANALVESKWDGVTQYSATTRRLRNRLDVRTTHLMWHWFYGGATADWAPTTDQFILIDSIKVEVPVA